MGIALLSSTFLAAQAQCCQKGFCHSEQASGKDCCAQEGLYTTSYADNPKLVKKAEKWAKKGAWKALFEYIAKTDLLTIPKGKHQIPGSDLTVSVEDSENGPLEKRQSESHYKHIDFQYVVKGVERFGIIDHLTSKPNCKYRPDVIHYDYDKSKARFYDSNPNEFFIFFPNDWHIAKINNDSNDQSIRVIVIKVDYVE